VCVYIIAQFTIYQRVIINAILVASDLNKTKDKKVSEKSLTKPLLITRQVFRCKGENNLKSASSPHK